MPTKDERTKIVGRTAGNVQEAIAVMDQTDGGEALVHALIRMVEDGRLKVRVYTRGRLHAKAYIFDWRTPSPGSAGIAIVGSSNLTLSGVSDNTELNVIVHDDNSSMLPGGGNHGQLTDWFNELWDESQDFEEHLMVELRSSWAGELARPYDVYMKTLYTLVANRLDDEGGTIIGGSELINRSLADFQKVAVRQAVRMIREHGGCFVADVVGLGKSYIGAAIVKHFEQADQKRALIICPKPLEEMWIAYNEQYHLNAQVLAMSMLQEGERGADLLDDVRYRDRDFVLIDESHNFRNSDSQRYQVLEAFIAADPERVVCLLTATPRNSHAMDVFHQIKLFHHEDITTLPINPPNLRDYFKEIVAADNGSANGRAPQLQDVLRHVLIRRTRRHILRWYGYTNDSQRPLSELTDFEASHYLDGVGTRRAYVNVAGRHQYFPKRELETLRYSIEDTYNGLYETLRGYLGQPARTHQIRVALQDAPPLNELTYARYGLFTYVTSEKRKQPPYNELRRSGYNLRGLIRTMLFKRFESSVHAFRETLRRMIQRQTNFLAALDLGMVAAGEKAERLLQNADLLDEDDLLDALESASSNYRIEDFEITRLTAHISADIQLMQQMLMLVERITPEHDDKLSRLKQTLAEPLVAGKKVLIFTQYADTAQYLYDNLNPGGRQPDIEVIYGTEKSKARVAARFAPKANPQIRIRPGEEIRILISTDVLAEGLNMQDCDVVINYDLHWNPVRLIQRFGRIDRIGSENDTVWGYNFLPELGIEQHLNLTEVLRRRIEEIHQTIGEDAAILDRTEQINPDAMYAIYSASGGSSGQLSFWEQDDQEADYVDLTEAEELFRRMKRDDPDEYQRIATLRDGIRSGMENDPHGRFVFCRSGSYQQLYLVDDHEAPLAHDIGRILAAIRATPETPTIASLPRDYNETVMRVKRRFAEEVRYRNSLQKHGRTLGLSQRYIQRELQLLFNQSDDDDLRQTINILEPLFVRMAPTTAVRRETDHLRRNGTQGRDLVNALVTIYQQHRLQDRYDAQQRGVEHRDVPQIVCSMALV